MKNQDNIINSYNLKITNRISENVLLVIFIKVAEAVYLKKWDWTLSYKQKLLKMHST